jgi:hypothetical protein
MDILLAEVLVGWRDIRYRRGKVPDERKAYIIGPESERMAPQEAAGGD